MNFVLGDFLSVLVMMDRMGVMFELVVKFMWWMVCGLCMVKWLLGGIMCSVFLVWRLVVV